MIERLLLSISTLQDNEAFIYNYNVTCFQNGKELDYPLASFDVDEYNNAARELQTGANITVARIYILEDKSDVDLEVTAWGSSKKLMKLTLKVE